MTVDTWINTLILDNCSHHPCRDLRSCFCSPCGSAGSTGGSATGVGNIVGHTPRQRISSTVASLPVSNFNPSTYSSYLPPRLLFLDHRTDTVRHQVQRSTVPHSLVRRQNFFQVLAIAPCVTPRPETRCSLQYEARVSHRWQVGYGRFIAIRGPCLASFCCKVLDKKTASIY